jgi:peptide/nickel transport system substrate-binding protein
LLSFMQEPHERDDIKLVYQVDNQSFGIWLYILNGTVRREFINTQMPDVFSVPMSTLQKRWKVIAAAIVLVVLAAGSIYYYAAPSNVTMSTTTSAPKVVTYAGISEMVTLDPSTEFSNSLRILPQLYDNLVAYVPDKTPPTGPQLATSWEVSSDGLTWTFHLRQGVKFHDGSPFNATAVKFSMDRTLSIGQGAAYIWSALKEVQVVDPYTVNFILKEPTPVDIIASSSYASYIMSPNVDSLAKAAGFNSTANWFNAGHEDGTGPYTLTKYDKEVEFDLAKFPEYWGGWTSDQFDIAVYKVVRDTTLRESMVKTGDASIVMDVPRADVPSLQADPNLKVDIQSSFTICIGQLNTLKFPFNNTLIRQAVSYAIPYKQIIDASLNGYGYQSVGPIPKGMPGHFDPPSLPQYTLDLNKARQLLAQAGYPNGGFKVVLTYSLGDNTEETTVALIKDSLSKLNIAVDARAMAWSERWAWAQSDPKTGQDIFVEYWWPTIVSPYDFLFGMFHSEKTVNFNIYYYNSTLDQLIDKGWAMEGVDKAQAMELYRQAEKLIIDNAAALYLWDLGAVTVYRSNISGFKYNPAWGTVVFFYQLHLIPEVSTSTSVISSGLSTSGRILKQRI